MYLPTVVKNEKEERKHRHFKNLSEGSLSKLMLKNKTM